MRIKGDLAQAALDLHTEVERLHATLAETEAQQAALVRKTREAALEAVQEFVVAHAFDTTVGRRIDEFIIRLLDTNKG